MQKNDIEELLRRHCQLSPLEQGGKHWVPENKTLEWYLGFVQSIEIQTGIRELFAEDKQQPAYEMLSKLIRSELAKFVGEKGSFSNSKVTEVFIEAILSLLIERVGVCVFCERLANVCDKANHKDMGDLFVQATKLIQVQKEKKK